MTRAPDPARQARLPAGTSLKLDRLSRQLEASRRREAALRAELEGRADGGGGGRVLVKAGPLPNRAALARLQRALAELPGVLDVEVDDLVGEWAAITIRADAGTQLAHVMRTDLARPFAIEPPGTDGRYTLTLG